MHQDLLKKVETFINQSSFQEKIKNADKIYHEFQDKFSPDKLRNLTGDELLNTLFSNNKQDMCWFLEFHPECKELMGTISGYASSTYEIYKKAATGQWMYKGKDSLSHDEILQKAYKIRDGLIDLCDIIKDNLSNLSTIAGYETLSQYWDNQKIWVKKYVHMIFPDYFPSIYKDELIENCADLLKLPLAKNKCAQAGSIVLEAKKYNLRNFEFAYVLGQISDKFIDRNSEKEVENGDIKENLIDSYEKKDALKMNNFPKNQILYGPPGTGKTYNTILKAMEILTFEDMFKNWFLSIRQKAGVDALNDYVRHIHKISSEYLKGQNIFSIYDKDQYNQLVETILASEYIKKDPVKDNESSWYKHALKRYGEFLEYLGEGQDRYYKISAEYSRMKSLGRIDFITFHQSYSYEEFVEGIKPMLSEMGDGSLKYILSDGIFKKICLEARSVKPEKKIDFSKIKIFKMSLGGASDTDVYQYCIEHNIVALGWGDNVDFTHAQTPEDIKKLYTEKTGKSDWAPEAVDRFKNGMRNGDIIIVSNKTRSFSAIAKIIGDYEYAENPDINYRHHRKVEWLYKGEDIPISKIYNKSLSQPTIYELKSQTKEGQADGKSTIKTDILNDIITGDIQKKGEESYVLIIDEINRGNISKIFGELITLIEEDKRGKISVTLPYSQKAFSVPENLYIIGTMNTADRSIATIDIALRRRFYFEEMMPNSTLVATNVEGINLQSVMNNLNKKIQVLLDRDHQIGHAYFMNILNKRQLENVWYSKILPLLNEYFYGDWEKLKLMVNSFIQEENIKSDMTDECSDDKLYSFKSLTGIDFYNAIKELEQ